MGTVYCSILWRGYGCGNVAAAERVVSRRGGGGVAGGGFGMIRKGRGRHSGTVINAFGVHKGGIGMGGCGVITDS